MVLAANWFDAYCFTPTQMKRQLPTLILTVAAVFSPVAAQARMMPGITENQTIGLNNDCGWIPAGAVLSNDVYTRDGRFFPAGTRVNVELTNAISEGCDSSYRLAYEKAIHNGLMRRPSLVDDEYELVQIIKRLLKEGKYHEASKRAAQWVVIFSEQTYSHPIHSEMNVKLRYVNHEQAWNLADIVGLESLRELKTFNKIIPCNTSGLGKVGYQDEFGSCRNAHL